MQCMLSVDAQVMWLSNIAYLCQMTSLIYRLWLTSFSQNMYQGVGVSIPVSVSVFLKRSVRLSINLFLSVSLSVSV